MPTTRLPYPDQESHEIFPPPYFFRGVRPSSRSAPATVSYGASFQVNTPNLGQVAMSGSSGSAQSLTPSIRTAAR